MSDTPDHRSDRTASDPAAEPTKPSQRKPTGCGSGASAFAEMDRREAMKWMAAMAAATYALNGEALGYESPPNHVGTDPNLVNPVVPWEMSLSDEQRRTLRPLCDAIIPADDRSPAASEVGVVDFIDEWVSAPYGRQTHDREQIVKGIDWLNAESNRRFDRPFHELSDTQRRSICDDICHPPEAKPEHREAAYFFDKVRNLTLGAFYTTQAGMDDIRYIGNVPLPEFPGPPQKVLEHLGLA